MTEKQFDKIVSKIVGLGNEYRLEIEKLERFSVEKYGVVWNELDCDGIIDSLQFGCGMLNKISFDEFTNEIETKLKLQNNEHDKSKQ